MKDYQKECAALENRVVILKGILISYERRIKSPCDAFGAMLGGPGKVIKKATLERLGLWDLDKFRAQLTDEDFIK